MRPNVIYRNRARCYDRRREQDWILSFNVVRLSFTLLFLILFSVTSIGQTIDQYTFEAVDAPYTEIFGGTQLSGRRADDNLSGSFPIGFTFVYEGVDYDFFKASTNGWITFNTALSSSYNSNSLSNPLGRPIVAPLWDDLENDNANGQKYMTFLVTGSAPNRVLTIEWHRQRWNYQSNNDVISFQCKLYETSNIIEFHYREGTSSVNSGSASIGLVGFSSGFSSLSDSGPNPTVSYLTETNTINTKPSTDQIYRWKPPVSGCSGTPSGGTANISVSSGCSGVPITLSATGQSTGMSYSYQWQSSPAPIGPWADIIGATNSIFNTTSPLTTTYYRLVTTCDDSGLSSNSSSVSYVVSGGVCECANYCSSNFTNASFEFITNVTFGSINNLSLIHI